MQSVVKIMMLVAVMVVLAACNPLREISNIRVTVTSEKEVMGNFAGGLFTEGFSFDMSEQQTFENSDATRDNLESSSLRSFTLEVKDPESQDLGFIEEMEVFIDTDGEDKRRISSYNEFSEDDQKVTFVTDSGVDLTPYFTAEEAEIIFETTAGQPENDTTLEVKMVFNINFFI